MGSQPGVSLLARANSACGHAQGASTVFLTDMQTFLSDPLLRDEMFGPAALIVRATPQQVEEAITQLEGQLTATLHASEAELANHGSLVAAMERRAGRLVLNSFPTGVEVCHSMVHGGPFPSTSDGRSTSVGSMAIYRFTRPVAYQSFPSTALPAELQDTNPLGIRRMINGRPN